MISSLQGNYLYVVIQVTRDFHPVVYFDWLLPGIEFELGVADVTLAQFETLAERLGRNEIVAGNTVGDWARSVSRLMISLEKLLKVNTPHHAFPRTRQKLIYPVLRCFRLTSTQLLISPTLHKQRAHRYLLADSI